MVEKAESKLCRKFTTVVILGLGGVTERIGRADARALRETIFGLDYETSQLKIFTNVSTVFDEMTKTQDEELINLIIKEVRAIQQSCDKISLVIFAHSHGAKMLDIALKKLLSEDPDGCTTLMQKMAIVTLGGVTFIKPEMAKIVMNVDCENDYHSKAAVKVGMGSHEEKFMKIGPIKDNRCMCCYPKPSENYTNSENSLNTVEATDSNSGFGLKAMWKFVPQFFHSTKVTGHYMSDYVMCTRWRKDLQSQLGVRYPSNCPCKQTPTENL